MTDQERGLSAVFPNAMLHYKVGSLLLSRRNGHRIFTLDLAFPDVKLDVELDGGVHRIPSRRDADARRTQRLQELGWTVLRFSNQEVIRDMTRVREVIESTISKLKATQATR